MERYYEAELKGIQQDIILMAEKAIFNTRRVLELFEKRDRDICRQIIAEDEEIDQLELKIDQAAVQYMTLYQPVSVDVRLIAMAIKTTHDIERIGDEASSIAKRMLRLFERDELPGDNRSEMLGIPEATSIALAMLKNAVDAFIEKDVAKCHSVVDRDAEVDSLNHENFEGFLERLTSERDNAEALMELVLISKSIERIADHAKNIAREVVYYVTGEELRHSGKGPSRSERGVQG